MKLKSSIWGDPDVDGEDNIKMGLQEGGYGGYGLD
jgi:hypothetical protein